MDIDLTESQEMLRVASRDFLVTNYPMSTARSMVDEEIGCPSEVWRKIVDLGWLGLAFSTDYGGENGSFLELLILLEEMGRVCFLGPFFSTVLLGGFSILYGGSDEQKNELLPQICKGQLLATMALTENNVSFKPEQIEMTAIADKESFTLSGIKTFVSDAYMADILICVARTKESPNPSDNMTVFLVNTQSHGLERKLVRTIDGSKYCDIIFNNVKVPRDSILGGLNKGWPIVEKVLDFAIIARCAEALGSAERILEITVQYAKDRHQFGQPIGSFEVIQHFCVDMLTDVDTMRLATYQAGWMLNEGIPCRKEVSMTKAWVGEAFKRVALYGLKIHGGTGYMLDHDMSLYFKRAQTTASHFGDSDFHRDKVAQELGI